MESTARHPYFAYGSNMDMDQMRDRCPDSRPTANARLDSFRIIINSRGVATIVKDDSSTVHGMLWQLSPPDEDNLDYYEGVKYGLYSKEYFRVQAEGGEDGEALIYIASDRVEGEPGGGYMRRILEAAQDRGLPAVYIAELRKWDEGS